MSYIAFDPEDRWYASICLTETDLQLCLSNIFGKRPFPTVLEYEIDGWCHDRTEEMREKYGPKPIILDYPEDGDWRRDHSRHMSSLNAFGRR